MKKLLVAGGIIGMLTASVIGCGKEEVPDTSQTVMTGEESPEELFNDYHEPAIRMFFDVFEEYDQLFGDAANNPALLQDESWYASVGRKTGELESVVEHLEEYDGPVPDEYQDAYAELQEGTKYLREMVDKTSWAVAPLAEGKSVRYDQLVEISDNCYNYMLTAKEKLDY